MLRVAALALVLCAGCSSLSTDSVVYDALFGDINSLFSGGESSASDRGMKTYSSPVNTPPSQAQSQSQTSKQQ